MILKIAYLGSPDFSARFLERIINDREMPVKVELVVTQPDKPVGRKQILTPSPVKVLAQKHGIPVFDSLTTIYDLLTTIDLCIVFAYGFKQLIPKRLLDIPKYGFWNIHPSLLPRYRGAAPIAYPLIMGDNKTGVSLMLTDEKMDHGPLIAQTETEILPQEKRPELTDRLSELGFNLLKRELLKLAESGSNGPQPIPQNHQLATFAPYLKKEDGFIPLPVITKALRNEPLEEDELPKIIKNLKFEIINSSKQIYNMFRGLYPWPGIWTIVDINGKELRLKITDVELINKNLVIKKVQLEGKNPVDFNTFSSAYNIF